MRRLWGITFVLGTGYMALNAVWPLYDSYVPKFYGEFISSSFLVGLIMGLDNFLGLTLQPWFGAMSDRTRTRWGRRRPYLLIGMPIAALGMLSIPFARESGLTALLFATILLNLSVSIFRSPTVALMPDITPPSLRSQANGIINFMGGIGAALILLLSKPLYEIRPHYPFAFSALILLLVFCLFLFFIQEPVQPQENDRVEEHSQGLLSALHGIIRNPDRSTLILFLSIFIWFAGYQSVNTWFTIYSEQHLGIPIHVASSTLIFYAGAFILGAIPAGIVGARLGRRKTILLGLSGIMLCFLALHFIGALNQVRFVLIIAGICWSLININAYPMVIARCRPNQNGTYTGLYYIFSMAAGAAAPSLTGLIFDLFGSMRSLFLIVSLFMACAIVLMLFVDDRTEATQSGEVV